MSERKKVAAELVRLAKGLVAGGANNETFKCPHCGTEVLKNTGYCVKCEKKVKEAGARRSRDETLGDAMKSLKKGKYTNYGDAGYIPYGGVQVKWDGRSFEMMDLHGPDFGFPGYLLDEGYLDVDDIFENDDPNTPISELVPKAKTKNWVSGLGGLRWPPKSAKDVAAFMEACAVGKMQYEGGDEVRSWMFDAYDIEDENDPDEYDKVEAMEEEVESDLKGFGLDL